MIDKKLLKVQIEEVYCELSSRQANKRSPGRTWAARDRSTAAGDASSGSLCSISSALISSVSVLHSVMVLEINTDGCLRIVNILDKLIFKLFLLV